jgi:hypothetical protein
LLSSNSLVLDKGSLNIWVLFWALFLAIGQSAKKNLFFIAPREKLRFVAGQSWGALCAKLKALLRWMHPR